MIWKKEKEREREHVPLLGDTLAQEFTTNDTFASLFNGYEFSQEFLQRFIKNKNWKKVGRKEEKDEMIVEITEGLSKL